MIGTMRQISRLLKINYILAKNGLDQVILSLHLFSPLRFFAWINPWNWMRREQLTRGVALRKTLEELGPIFIKFGQALSVRPDILPADIALELAKLQDKVMPFSSEQSLAILEATFGCSAYALFAEFDAAPLASASVAQVHAATLKTGEKVVVKLLRPNVAKMIQQDLEILYTIARLADRYWPESRRFRPIEVVQEFEQSLMDELDLQREAANASQLKRNFHLSPLLYVPSIFWEYTRANVLVMERIHGIPVSDLSRLLQQGVNVKKLAERGVEIFFTQVFRDSFFHADMHPGNIFVSVHNPDEPQYICVDFGIVGSLNEHDQRYLAENLYAFFNHDYRRVAQLHIESGWVARGTRVEALESAVRTVCEPIFKKTIKEISLAQLMMRLFQVMRRFEMEVQPQLILLQKTLFAIEGLGRQLYPDLDLWITAKPYLEKWLRDQIGPRSFLKNLKGSLPFLSEQLPQLPRMVYEVLRLTKDEKLKEQEQDNIRSFKRRSLSSRRSGWGSGFLLGVLTTLLSTSVGAYLGYVFVH